MIEAGGWIEGWWMMCEFRWREMSVPLSRRRYTYPNLSPRFWGRDAGPGSRVRWIAGRDIAEFGTQIRTAGGVEGPAPSPIRAFFRWIRKIRLGIRPFVAKPGTMGKGERLSRMWYVVLCDMYLCWNLWPLRVTRHPAHWVAEVFEDAAVFRPSPSHDGPKKGIPRLSSRRTLVHSRNGGAETLLFPWGLSVMWDESRFTKFPFLVLIHVTLPTVAQARLSPCSVFSQAGSPLLTLITVFGSSAAECWITSTVTKWA